MGLEVSLSRLVVLWLDELGQIARFPATSSLMRGEGGSWKEVFGVRSAGNPTGGWEWVRNLRARICASLPLLTAWTLNLHGSEVIFATPLGQSRANSVVPRCFQPQYSLYKP